MSVNMCVVEILQLFDKVYFEKVFSSKRENENKELLNKYYQVFNMFDKYSDKILELIDANKYEVWVFLGAGQINNKIYEIISK